MAKKKKAEEEEEDGGGKGKAKFVVIGVVGLAAVYKFVLAPSPAPADGTDEATAAEEAPPEEGEIFPLDELVVNLADTDESRYLRVGIALVLEKGFSAIDMESEAAIALDSAIEVLSGKTFDELRVTGAKTAVRDELSTAVRAAYGDEKVVRVLLTSFVMQ